MLKSSKIVSAALFFLLLGIDHPARAEKTTAEKAGGEVTIALIRTLHPAGTERIEVYCAPKRDTCKAEKFVKERPAGTANLARATVQGWVKTFFRTLPKGDVKTGLGMKEPKPREETTLVWYVNADNRSAEGEILQVDSDKPSPAGDKRVDALAALEMKILGVLKSH